MTTSDDGPDGPATIDPADDGLDGERLVALIDPEGHSSGRVTAAEAIGTGQMASSYRVTLTWDDDDPARPGQVVVKVPTGTPVQRSIAANSYRAEVDFYRTLAPSLDARMPTCFGAWRNDTGDDFLVVLEDLAPWQVGDQIAGCDPQTAAVVMDNLAGVHGPVWQDPRLAELLPGVDADGIEGTAAVFGALTDLFLASHRERLSSEAADVCEAFAPLASRFLGLQADRIGIVHGDYRLDNLLFAPDRSDVAVIDWQTVGCGMPARDLAYFLGTSLPADTLRTHRGALIGRYHDGLVQRGVTGYGVEECRADYAFGLFQIPLSVMFGSAIATPTDRGAAMFAAMIERGAAAMIDVGTLDLV